MKNKMQKNRTKSQFISIVMSHRKRYITAIVLALVSMLCILTIPVVIKNIIDIVLTDQSTGGLDFVRWIFEWLGGKDVLTRNLWMATVAVIGLYAVYAFLMYLTILIIGVVSETIIKEIRDRLFKKFQQLSYAFYSVEKTGDLIQRSTSDVIAANNFLSNQLTEIGRMAIMIIILIPYMFVINVKMAALSLVLSPFIAVLAVHYFRLFFRQSIKIEENESELTSTIQENLAGIRVVRAFARHALEREKFAKRSGEYYQSVVRYIDNYARFFGYTTTLAFGQLGIVLVGGSWMVIHNWISVGTLVAFFTYSTAIAFTLRGLGVMLGDTSGAIVAIRRIEKILSTPVAVFAKDAAEVKLRGEIQFENVSFSYRKNQKILDNVTFHITPGERIAIVGPSGSGKSTIIELLLRNYDYQSGSIMLDDRELKDLDPRKVRSQIGTSLQDVFLFSDTVRSNIKMAKTNATDGEVKTASETAKIHDTIHEFPEKYDTHIGEKGVDLSGGQRQRMVLARAFVRKPPILILDDSLSAVDVHTEREILQELNKKHDDVTVIIVTHRLSCCLNADRILVLEDGKLTKIGAHSELIQEEGFYKRLWEIQQEIEQVSDKTELQT